MVLGGNCDTSFEASSSLLGLKSAARLVAIDTIKLDSKQVRLGEARFEPWRSEEELHLFRRSACPSRRGVDDVL